MLTTTTDTLQGRVIKHYLGLVMGHAVVSTNMLKSFRGGIRDVSSGRPPSYEMELETARELALKDLIKSSEKMGANAVIVIDIDYQTVGDSHHLVMVSIAGTAVIIDDETTIDHDDNPRFLTLDVKRD
jgi:uncharacterized protein YbjQ (UPF0145 family)